MESTSAVGNGHFLTDVYTQKINMSWKYFEEKLFCLLNRQLMLMS